MGSIPQHFRTLDRYGMDGRVKPCHDDNSEGQGWMANRHRGEIAAVLGGRERILCLTLGALAELEAALGVGDLVALAERLGSGRLSARDVAKIIGCGLRGAGEKVSDDEVAAMRAEGGVAGFARIAAELIKATFGGEGEEEREGARPPREEERPAGLS